MAPSFARSISFPMSPSPSRSSKQQQQQQQPPPRMGMASYHARSVSLPLPCRSHPILAHLHTHIRAVRAWAAHNKDPISVTSGLAHVDALHAALADLLDLPEAQAALSSSAAADRLLDAFLRLADAHGTFQEALLDLRRDVAEALAAVRRRDGARLASALRSQRRAAKELSRLAAAAAKDGAAAYRLSRLAPPEAEVAGLLAEAASATASASAALFNTVAAMAASASAAACSSCNRTAALMCLLLNKKAHVPAADQESAENNEEATVERLEECIHHLLHSGSDKVFRSLVQTRVALLNVHTNFF
ncbi:unnamed protein product [Urochloa humidicola]